MATKRELEERISELEGELEDADSRIDELESTLSGIADQAGESLPEESDNEDDDSD